MDLAEVVLLNIVLMNMKKIADFCLSLQEGTTKQSDLNRAVKIIEQIASFFAMKGVIFFTYVHFVWLAGN